MSEDRKQLILDTCGVHLLKQKAKSSEGSGCVYFSANGLGCGAQPLLNEEAKQDAEQIIRTKAATRFKLNSTSIRYIPDNYFKDEFQNLTPDELKFAVLIQVIHDKTEVCAWHDALSKLAAHHNLSTEKIDAVTAS